MKDNNNKRLNELIKMNEEKERKINILENKYKELKEKIEKIEENKKDRYRDEINLIYVTKKGKEKIIIKKKKIIKIIMEMKMIMI